LVVTALEDVTADLVIAALGVCGAHVARVDPADLGTGLHFAAQLGPGENGWSGLVRTASRTVRLERVRAVYYRRPSPWRFDDLPAQASAFARAEARHGLGGVLEALPHARYVNHPAAVARAEVKPAGLQAAARLGLQIPDTLITNDLAAARAFAAAHPRVVYKPLRGLPAAPDGRTGAIWAQRIDSDSLDERVAVTAHLFQAEIHKSGDARVTVVGAQVFAQRIEAPDGALDWRSGDWSALIHTPIEVPGPVAAACRAYLKEFDLVFGCFDFALVPDVGGERWVFVECNPNGQWGWLPDSGLIAASFATVLLEGCDA
jgi:ATP-grasp ribosomal peptide maturase